MTTQSEFEEQWKAKILPETVTYLKENYCLALCQVLCQSFYFEGRERAIDELRFRNALNRGDDTASLKAEEAIISIKRSAGK